MGLRLGLFTAGFSLLLHARATSVARVVGQRTIQLDSIALCRNVWSLARLSKYPNRRGIPRYIWLICQLTGSFDGISDGRLERYIDGPQILPLTGSVSDYASFSAILCHGGKVRALATNASISADAVSANFCSNNTAVNAFLNANFIVN